MTSAKLPAGKWHGHFAYSVSPDDRHPTQLHLEMDGARIRGKGQDGDGRYEVEGTAAPDGTVRWQKRYEQKGGASVAYLGRWDAAAGELAGRWRIVNTEVHGRFALRPGEAAAALPDAGETPAKLARELTGKWQRYCRIDLDLVRFDGERTMLAALLADGDFVKALRETSATLALDGEKPPAREALTPNLVRLERAVLPHVFTAVDRCVAALGLTARVDVCCENDGTLNACVTPGREGAIRITLSSGAINALDVDELTYVIGHEIGHAILGHLGTGVFGDAELSGVVQLRRLALSRYQELSADRVGLICCPDVAKALRAEFMLHSGVTLRDAIGDAASILRAAQDAVGIGSGEAAPLTDDARVSTHPYGPMRTLATDWFGRSTTFHTLIGRKGGEIDEAELESRVKKLVELMNPTILEQSTKRSDIVEFMALAGLSVAEATGGAAKQEVAAIKRLGKAIGEALERARRLSFEEQQLRIVELAEQLALALPPQKRHRIVEDLAVIAEVDGEVSEAEQQAMAGLSALLGVDPFAAADVLGELQAGLD